MVSVVVVVRGTSFSVTSAFSAQGRGRRSRVTSSPLRARFHLWWNREVLRVQSGKWIARICLCFISNVLFSVVVVHPRTALNAILLVLLLFGTFFLFFFFQVLNDHGLGRVLKPTWRLFVVVFLLWSVSKRTKSMTLCRPWLLPVKPAFTLRL